MVSPVGNRAIVLGGSIAGVLAARVLAEFYRDVLVVDRDQLLGVSGPRRGAPHTRHAHGLHARGQLVLEELFPGLTEDLRAQGVPLGDLGEMRWYFDARKLAPARTGLVSVTGARPEIEHEIRTRVAAIGTVRFLQGHGIVGLVATPDRSRVVGVRVQERVEGAPEQVLDADLVVDATGRGSRTPAWLEELGYTRPEEERVKVGLAYTTRQYRLRPGMFDGVQSINPVASPAHPRGAFFGQIGKGRAILSLTGLLGDHPPTDPEAFLEFTRTLPVPDVYEAMHDAEPLDDPVSFTFPASVRRHYERLSRFPAGLLLLGDALCSFNPVYGQGMSVAAVEALTLREHLRGGHDAPARYLREVARVIDAPWAVAAGGDLDFPGVVGRRTVAVRVGNAYLARLRFAATKDAAVTDAFMRVAGLIDPPTALMRPAMVARVLRHGVRKPQPGPARPARPAAGRAAADDRAA